MATCGSSLITGLVQEVEELIHDNYIPPAVVKVILAYERLYLADDFIASLVFKYFEHLLYC